MQSKVMAPIQVLYLLYDHSGELVVFYFGFVRGTLRLRQIIVGTLFALAAFLSPCSGKPGGELLFLILAPRQVRQRGKGGRSCSTRLGWSLCSEALTGLPQQCWNQALPGNACIGILVLE